MTVHASTASNLIDSDTRLELRAYSDPAYMFGAAGATYQIGVVGPLPRKVGSAYWQAGAPDRDHSWRVRCVYRVTGNATNVIELRANDSPSDTGIPICVISLSDTDGAQGQVTGLVDASVLKIVPEGSPLYLQLALHADGAGSIQAGVWLERVSP